MLTTAEQKALAKLEWSDQFQRRTKWIQLVLALGVIVGAARIFYSALALLETGVGGAPLVHQLFWPGVAIACVFWGVGLILLVRVVSRWHGNARDILVIRLARELSHQRAVAPN
jgi:hypothetical protein